jgi:hypothetical protein
MRAAWGWVALAAWGLGGCIATSGGPGGKFAASDGDMATPLPAAAPQRVDSNNNPNARRRAYDGDRNVPIAERGRQDVVTRFDPVSLGRVSFERAGRFEAPVMGAAERRMDACAMGRR